MWPDFYNMFGGMSIREVEKMIAGRPAKRDWIASGIRAGRRNKAKGRRRA